MSESMLIHQPVANNKSGLGKIVVSLSAIAIVSKFFGFAEKLLIAHFFGTEAAADVYFASMGIILAIVFLAKELVYPSLLPVFSKAISGQQKTGGDLFRKVFLIVGVLLLIVCFGLVFFSDVYVKLLLPGFSGDKKYLTSVMLKLLGPSCLLLGLSTITYTVLNSHGLFLCAATAETILKFVVVAGLIVLIPLSGIYATAIILTIGAVICLGIQFYFVPEKRLFLKPNLPKADKNLKHFLRLMSPLIIGVVFSHVSGLFDNLLASTLPAGGLSYLGYSKKVIDAILLIGPVALVTVVYSQLAHYSATQNHDKFRELFARALRLMLYISVPASILLISLKEPFVKALFERGRFTAQSTLGTSNALFIYAIGLVTFSLESLVVYSFYALSDTKTPVKAGILCVVVDIVLAVILLRPFEYLGIAWASVISKTAKLVILLAILQKRFNFLFSRKNLSFLIRLAAANLLPMFALYFLIGTESSISPIHAFIFELVVPASAFLTVFTICSYLMKIEELGRFFNLVLRRKNFQNQLAGENL